MSIHNELRYSEYLNIAKSCRITIEDYLLKAYDYLNKEFYQLAEELFKLENIENLEELKSILVNSNILIDEEQFPFIYTKIVLKDDMLSIIDNFGICPSEFDKIKSIQQKKKTIKS